MSRADDAGVVWEMRRLYQEAIRQQACALVEEITGRRVKTFLSDHSIEHDFAIECFVREPLPRDEHRSGV